MITQSSSQHFTDADKRCALLNRAIELLNLAELLTERSQFDDALESIQDARVNYAMSRTHTGASA